MFCRLNKGTLWLGSVSTPRKEAGPKSRATRSKASGPGLAGLPQTDRSGQLLTGPLTPKPGISHENAGCPTRPRTTPWSSQLAGKRNPTRPDPRIDARVRRLFSGDAPEGGHAVLRAGRVWGAPERPQQHARVEPALRQGHGPRSAPARGPGIPQRPGGGTRARKTGQSALYGDYAKRRMAICFCREPAENEEHQQKGINSPVKVTLEREFGMNLNWGPEMLDKCRFMFTDH